MPHRAGNGGGEETMIDVFKHI